MKLINHLLCFLLLLSTSSLHAQTPANKIATQHADKAQAVETIIQKQLELLKQGNDYLHPILLKSHGIPIRNPFTKLPPKTLNAFARQGIDLKTMASWKTLYIAGHLTGAFGKKIINTDPKTIMVIGTDTSTHEGIYSRGPVVMTGEILLLSDVYGKSLVWYGESASHEGPDPDIGLPRVASNARWPDFNLGISPYLFAEELQAIKRLGKTKTHRDKLPKTPVKTTNDHASTNIADLKSPIIIPGITSVETRATDTTRCEYYAENSVRQHQTNLKNGCGFSGLRWNNDKTGQVQWCMQTVEHITAAETDARAEQLTACFNKKAAPTNPENRPVLPQACHDPKKQWSAVKTINHEYRYERTLKHPVGNGLIRYDYNQDKKPDYLFLEVNQNTARVMACFSQNETYQRSASDISFSITSHGTSGEKYRLSQHKGLLKVEINYFGHNEGSSWRKVAYRYQPEKRGFVVVSNKSGVNPVVYDGQPYPMGAPETPKIISAR